MNHSTSSFSSSSSSSSSSSRRLPSPSPSPRSMHRMTGARIPQQQELSLSSSSLATVRPQEIPHSTWDQSRLHLEAQLDTRSSINSHINDDEEEAEDESLRIGGGAGLIPRDDHSFVSSEASSVEFARGLADSGHLRPFSPHDPNGKRNNSYSKTNNRSIRQASYADVYQHNDSPASSKNHHASQVTIGQQYLVGTKGPLNVNGGNKGSGRGSSFGDDGRPPMTRDLAEKAFQLFGNNNKQHHQRKQSASHIENLENAFPPPPPSRPESSFTKLARQTEAQLGAAMRGASSADMRLLGLGRNAGSKPRHELPDVTGLTDALATPAKTKGPKELGRDVGVTTGADGLNALHSAISNLQQETVDSRNKISDLESEIQVLRDREEAFKLESKLASDNPRAKDEKYWEKMYWRVVEEKKVLEDQVSSLLEQLAELQAQLTSHKQLIADLQEARRIDAKEITRRGQEVERLRSEVHFLAQEVKALRGAVENAIKDKKTIGIRHDSERPLIVFDDLSRHDQRTRDFHSAPSQPQPSQGYHNLQLPDSPRSAKGGRTRTFGADKMAGLKADISTHLSSSPFKASRLAAVRATATSPGIPPQLYPLPPSPMLPHSPVDSQERLAEGTRRAAGTDGAGSVRSVTPVQSIQPQNFHSSQTSSTAERRPLASSQHQQHQKRRSVNPDVSSSSTYAGSNGEIVIDEEEPAITQESKVPKSTSHHQQHYKSSAQPIPKNAKKLPPQTVLSRVLRELEDDFDQYKSVYSDLADQYKAMDPASNQAKRNILAEHLKEVIDILEQKGDQISSLYSLLSFQDRPSLELFTEKEKRAFKSVKDLIRSAQKATRRSSTDSSGVPSPPRKSHGLI